MTSTSACGAHRGLPPGPSLNADTWKASERDLMEHLREFCRTYGPVFTVHAEGRRPRVYVADPQAIQDIFVRHQEDLEGLGPSMFKALVTDRSVAYLNGHVHRKTRHLLGHALEAHDPSLRARTIARIVADESDRLEPGVENPLEHFTNRVTRGVILEITFGRLSSDIHLRVLDSLDRAMTSLHEQQNTPSASCPESGERLPASFSAALADLDRILLLEIVRRRTDETRQDCVVSRLLSSSTATGKLTDQDIALHVKTLLVSGHETTSAALAWALLHLSLNPVVLDALRQEITAELAPEDLLRLPYLNAVCLEVLRHSAPVPNGGAREVVREFHAQGYLFPPGTEIVPAIHLTHQREQTFANACAFAPKRFQGVRYGHSEFLPFGIGPRHCLGATLALQELRIAVAEITRRADLHVVLPRGEIMPISMGPTQRLPKDIAIYRSQPSTIAPRRRTTALNIGSQVHE
ncbi:cytochrome P450 [Streptomyces sp. NBC_01304]|uniref:cytochrome P450 n=1 Tax=Streptomyces sp. NBC_01304 TaxID=2903818 RepID=UPI002E11003B|nr:cytochrome P450 [Streptomyces sp. NBC_01304]